MGYGMLQGENTTLTATLAPTTLVCKRDARLLINGVCQSGLLTLALRHGITFIPHLLPPFGRVTTCCVHALDFDCTVGRAIVRCWPKRTSSLNCSFTHSARSSFPYGTLEAQRFHPAGGIFLWEIGSWWDPRMAQAALRSHRCEALDPWVANLSRRARALWARCQHWARHNRAEFRQIWCCLSRCYAAMAWRENEMWE